MCTFDCQGDKNMEKNNGKEKRARELFAKEVQEEKANKGWNYNRNLLETSIDSLVTIGPDGIITDVNSATERATGLPREKIIGTDFSEYFTEPDKARVGYKQVFDIGKVVDYELYLKHINGSSIDMFEIKFIINDLANIKNLFISDTSLVRLGKVFRKVRADYLFSRKSCSLFSCRIDICYYTIRSYRYEGVNACFKQVAVIFPPLICFFFLNFFCKLFFGSFFFPIVFFHILISLTVKSTHIVQKSNAIAVFIRQRSYSFFTY